MLGKEMASSACGCFLDKLIRRVYHDFVSAIASLGQSFSVCSDPNGRPAKPLVYKRGTKGGPSRAIPASLALPPSYSIRYLSLWTVSGMSSSQTWGTTLSGKSHRLE